MKTLILYETKKGYTLHCADFIKKNIENSEIFDVRSDEYNLDDYDTVLVGAPIYIGKIEKKTARFFFIHQQKLLKKRLGIFCAGMNKEEFNKAVQESIPPNIFYHAEIVHCGGKIEYKKLSLKEKFTVWRYLGITKSDEYDNMNDVSSFLHWARGEREFIQ